MKNNQAFSLLELSIVLTIIAIIVSGVTISGRFVKLSQVNNIVAEAGRYHSFMRIFELKHSYYAGDFPDGTAMWGNDCLGASLGTDLCSGDGDDTLETGTPDERFLAWKHLSNDKILLDFYPFEGTSEVDEAPTSGLSNGSIYIYESATKGILVSLRSRADAWNAISHKDAYIIDNKIDDGVLDTGDVFGECGSGITTYDFTLLGTLCGLSFY